MCVKFPYKNLNLNPSSPTPSPAHAPLYKNNKMVSVVSYDSLLFTNKHNVS